MYSKVLTNALRLCRIDSHVGPVDDIRGDDDYLSRLTIPGITKIRGLKSPMDEARWCPRYGRTQTYVLVTGPRPKGGNQGDKGLPFKLRSVS